MRRTLLETIARAEWLMAEDGIARMVVRDRQGDYWVAREEASALVATFLEDPVLVWLPNQFTAPCPTSEEE
jgi:hypothetical protein